MAFEGTVHQEIDVRGTQCPMPVLKTKKALALMQTGEVLCVLATDPASVADIAQFAEQTGHTVLLQEKLGEEIRHYVKRR